MTLSSIRNLNVAWRVRLFKSFKGFLPGVESLLGFVRGEDSPFRRKTRFSCGGGMW